jgi:hypothetical protein
MNLFLADRDSLLALDALLRIRQSDASQHGGSTKIDSGSPPTVSRYSPNSVTGWNKLLPINAAGLLLPQVSSSGYSPAQQFAGAQAAAAALRHPRPSAPSRGLVVQDAHTITRAKPPSKTTSSSEPGDKIKNAAGKSAADTKEVAISIRREKVEAALNSKPQRGRKREDLSEKERLELTRTRNREHAKSTR